MKDNTPRVTSLKSYLQHLPQDASEAIVSTNFARYLISYLGFSTTEIIPQYDTGGGGITDFATRRNLANDIFLQTKSNPFLLIELKGRDINLTENSPSYKATVNQLKRQLLGTKCQASQWGIINNSSHIQLFRKHGKTIFPATTCIELTPENIDETVALIKTKIDKTPKALTVTVYNNKGGIGKTTTTVNLAAFLAFLGKKVLVLDFDFNQRDLTKSILNIEPEDGLLEKTLTDRNIELKSVIRPYTFKNSKLQITFDVVPAEPKMAEYPELEYNAKMTISTLHRKLDLARYEYDYIFIDAAPNWRFTSRLAVYAADVVLLPTKHNNSFSLHNAATAIKEFLPQMQKLKKDGTPIALPIFFNGEKITQPQLELAQKEINQILKNDKTLLPYFYPRYTNAKKDLHIHHLPEYAIIASAAFERVPAVYKNRSAHDYYKDLAKEYFLQ
ncbi:MAG: AAA family ATPase [Microcystis sp.]|jgi:cellulose biosynthesis protein BcsQ|uniref:AAA family ATPase n=1 Tax=unclassified Microcystis TaxID=2643300 RepID=UPI0022BFB542|nr:MULTISPECIES: AAA family ATPase [unclassified Microcystis]MCE2670888.1 AAA family ATPase [Microcystis sp. 49638_E5]MCZ8056849.1 AAA family ATPase [Microcystis sp. LE19-12.2C]MDJ0549173.1 AAA family ATPase [Microcystis sp. M49637_WE12]MDJ0585670.1 AAA family ATPase [Microcystis sp. M49636_WE2]